MEELVFKTDIDLGDGAKSLKSLKQEFKETQKELDGLQVGSEQYINTLKKLGNTKDEIALLNDQINAFADDAGRIKAVGNVVGGIAGGFSAATGAAALFGGENKELEKTLIKVQAALALQQGLEGLKNLGDGFKVLGAVIKANPLMLIGTIIIGIGTALFALKDKLGVVGKAFDAIGDVIGYVTDKIKEFTDWIGISSFAFDKANESILENTKKTRDAVIDRYDSQIAAAKREHKETVYLEIEKQKAILETNRIAIEALERKRKANGSLNDEELAQLAELRKENSAAYRAITDAWAAHKDEVAAKDAQATEKYNAELDKKKAADAQATEKYKAELQKRHDEEIKKRKETVEYIKQLELDIYAFQAQLAEEKKAEEDKALAELEAAGDAETERILRQREVNKELQAIEAQGNLERQLEILEAERAQELAVKGLTAQDKLLIDTEYDAKRRAITQQAINDDLAGATRLTNSLAALSDIVFTVKRSNLKKGSAEDLKAAKQQFNINKGLALSGAIITGIQSVMAAYASGLATPIVGPATGAIYAVMAGVVAAANIVKIATSKFDPGGGGGGAAASIGAPVSAPAPAINAPQNSNTLLNPDGSVQNNPANSEPAPIKVFVTEGDIREKATRADVLENQATIK